MNPQLIAILNQAIQYFQSGNLNEAERLLNQILQLDSSNPPALQILGLVKATQGNLKEAAKLLKKAVKLNPNDPSLVYNLAKVLSDSGDEVEAIIFHEKFIKLAPNNSNAWLNYSKSLANIKKFTQALVAIEKVVLMEPNNPDAWNNQGAILKELGRVDEAIKAYQRALQLKTDFAEALYNLGIAYAEKEDFPKAIEYFEKAIEQSPSYYAAYNNKGVALTKLMRYEEALTALNQSLQIKPDYIEGLINKYVVHLDLGDYENAIKSLEKILILDPHNLPALINLGMTFSILKNYPAAQSCHKKALLISPNNASAWHNLGAAYEDAKDYINAIPAYERALQLDPNRNFLLGQNLSAKMHICDWSSYGADLNVLINLTKAGKKTIHPFPFLAITDSEELHQKAAQTWIKNFHSNIKQLPEDAIRARNSKIRIGYFSADFRNHAVANLIVELLEFHDKSQFEIFAFSYSENDSSPVRSRIIKACDHFIDISKQSDLAAAELSKELKIDIAIDLTGLTANARPGIFAHRAAPIQINYLGYPGTMGADFIDYIIADKVVIPESSQQFYSEKVLYLPNCYQPNDSKRPISDRKLTKAEVGLPEEGFVFCCFNNTYKITPETFESWMRILKAVDGSVLWLFENNSTAAENLRKFAQNQGVDPGRMVFAKNTSLPEHLGRYCLADLFLDTLPYNAHTTAGDALWMDLPVITQMGKSFAGRVASSLLNAVGLPELIVDSQQEYELLAIELASQPLKLQTIKKKLSSIKKDSYLFNTNLLVRDIENIYKMVFNIRQ